MAGGAIASDRLAMEVLKDALEGGRIRIVDALANDYAAWYDYEEVATGERRRVTCTYGVAAFAREQVKPIT